MKKLVLAHACALMAVSALAVPLALPCPDCVPLKAVPLIASAKAIESYDKCGADHLSGEARQPDTSLRAAAENVAKACEDALKPVAAASAAAGKREFEVEREVNAWRERSVQRWMVEILRMRSGRD